MFIDTGPTESRRRFESAVAVITGAFAAQTEALKAGPKESGQ